jgi:hypothetical protein
MNNKKILLTICLITLLLFSSCTLSINDALKKAEYTVTQGANYKDFVQPGNARIEFVSLSTESINYYYEVYKYTEEQRLDFINKVEVLRDYLEFEAEVSFDKTLSIYISDDNTLQGIDGKLFLNELSINSIDSTIAFLQALFGANSNYGLSYGIACYINEKIYDNAFTSNISIEELGKFYSIDENIVLMDLTIPVFKDVYFTEEQNSYTYETAYFFIKDLIERKGFKDTINLLNNSSKLDISFDIEYTNEKNIWLKNIGATQICETPIVPLRYEIIIGNKAKTYPYVINSPSINSYFTIKEGELRHEGVIMDYAYIKHYLKMYEHDISALKKYLEPYFDTNKEVIDCYFGEDKMNYAGGNIKYVTPLKSGVHEYTHYLTSNDFYGDIIKESDKEELGDLNDVLYGKGYWMVEGIAEYCSEYLEEKDIYRMKTEYYNKKINHSVKRLYNKNFIDSNKNESYLKFFQELYAIIESRYNTEDKASIARVYNYIKNLNLKNDQYEGIDLTYNEASSLVYYLITTYGEEKFFQLYKEYSKLKELYGKTYEELLKEWKNSLYNKYKFEYFIGPEDCRIPYFGIIELDVDSEHPFIKILGGHTYEYVYCETDLNNKENSNLNYFESLNLKGKIALINYDNMIDNIVSIDLLNILYDNMSEAGAIGVIIYIENPMYKNMIGFREAVANLPTICITREDGEYLKEAKDKKITIDKDFFGTIDNSSSGN